ncbi:DUF2218 domain-containing protein [Vibrio anguillarum]|uniref:DUF2218 domain-containing protein n=1 Tax=Vibrio anguillarum TaxID=55601 RepID=UPI00188A7E72|nr:DUF2218 domain-containing protein [Vibrio anguillarum]MBF4252989.1 DUF2218 domain-containing protein [Vibrio anguillarum]
MLTSTAVIHSSHSAKYLTVLCRHFSRKVTANWNETEGEVHFPSGVTSLLLDETKQQLLIQCHSENQQQLEQQMAIINSHIQMFARREPITLEWKTHDIA